ncbi:hypothetical protein DVH05_023939 [Phytophthora capsici]|nr:hypothetical protein DVH05_023939 [Phytophthora capsici]
MRRDYTKATKTKFPLKLRYLRCSVNSQSSTTVNWERNECQPSATKAYTDDTQNEKKSVTQGQRISQMNREVHIWESADAN